MEHRTTANTSLLAVASVTCALLFFLPPAWAAGIVLGVVALVEIKQSGGARRGRGLAIAGIVLSVIWALIFGGLLLRLWTASREAADAWYAPDAYDTDHAADDTYEDVYDTDQLGERLLPDEDVTFPEATTSQSEPTPDTP